ncbi:MAG: WD40 repeat domain-containing protein [Gemmataceae bacterium]
MVATCVVRCSAVTLGLTIGATLVASGQSPEVEAALKTQLEELRLKTKLKQPKTDPKLAGKVVPPISGLPEGAIARLGDSRLRHAGKPLCVTFSPDSKHVLSGGEDGMLRVWDVASGETVNSLHSPDGTVRQARFTQGGNKLAVQFSGNRVHFVNPDTLKETSQFETEYGTDFSVSADGRMIAHSIANGMLRITEIEKNLEKLEVPAGSPFLFHPNNKHFAVADAKGVITLYLLAGGKPVLTLDNGDSVNSLVFSPDGKRIACGGGNSVKVWDITDGKTAKSLDEIKDASRVGEWLDNNRFGLSDGESAGVYDLNTRKWASRVRGISGNWAISPDGTKIVSTGSNGLRIRIWDLKSGTQLHADNDTFPEAALFAPAADGKNVFILAGENAFLWPIDKNAATVTGQLPGKVLVAAVAKDRLAVATPEAVHVYDDFDPLKPLPSKPSRTITELSAACRAIAVSPDGKSIAYSGEANRIQIANATTGKLIRTLPVVTAGIALEFSPDSEKLAIIGRDGFLRLTPATEAGGPDFWKVRVQRGQRGSVAFSPDGKLIAASSSGLIKVANASDGRDVFSVGGLFDNGLFQQLTFSRDGRLLLAASEGMTGGVRAWELATHSLAYRFTTGFGTVYRFGLFPDGTRFVSAGAEETITAWDLTGRNGKDAPKAEELQTAWDRLDTPDAAIGYPAAVVLSAGQARSVKPITVGIQDTMETRKRITKWIADLASEKAEDRGTAGKELLASGARGLSALQAAAKSGAPEVMKRAAEILGKLKEKVQVADNGIAGDNLRLLRAAQVLEDIGTQEVLPLLRQIEEFGGPEGEAATAALRRLEKP